MTTSRNFWPLGITTVCALFFAGTVGLVVMACSQKVELVRQIDRAERARREAPQTSVSFDAAHQQIRICLPPGQGRENVSGTIELYRPSAAGLDRAMPLEPDAEGTQRLDAARLAPGLWKVRVSWTCEKRNYYLEQKVVVSPRPA